MAEKRKEKRPLIINDARPLAAGEFRDNKDGTRSTEVLIGVQIDGRETLIPSLWMTPDGIVDTIRTYGDEEGQKKAREFALRYMKETGKSFPSFATIEEAEAFARNRSNKGGRFSGELGAGE